MSNENPWGLDTRGRLDLASPRVVNSLGHIRIPACTRAPHPQTTPVTSSTVGSSYRVAVVVRGASPVASTLYPIPSPSLSAPVARTPSPSPQQPRAAGPLTASAIRSLRVINAPSAIRSALRAAGRPVTSLTRRSLCEADLYNDDARPPVLATPKPHHVCGICFSVKSHPVSYLCGHSHCYVCIRIWLGRRKTCPECTQVMHIAPFRHYGEELGIAFDYPFWVDDSRVLYSFEGLVFPRAGHAPVDSR
ncbi:hypothetical protein K438DRAFT_1991382 [Mycena galopus ATCC 62051]|nr:hypothetical protein K438DRAFT_1991382 [Mycena galopus ATCC 62051]